MALKAVIVGTWHLVREDDDAWPAYLNVQYADFRGDLHEVLGGTPPHKPGSTGRVDTSHGTFYPGVIGLKWINKENQNAQEH